MKKKYPLIVSLIFLALAGICYWLGIIVNLTSSMPQGIYLRAGGDIARNDIIAFCLHEPYKTFGLKRGYLIPGLRCQGSMPLIKKVIALPGDDVVLRDQTITVNNQTYSYPTYYRDSLNRPLKVYPRGHYLKTPGYWVIGSENSHSWDSRYWGPLSRKQILGKFFLLFIFS